MATVWFVILSLMLATYVVLDGFDLGVGILHLLTAKTDDERRTVLASIGPVWDGNEVWLIASGGVLVFSFPKVYAAGFSGFYLPLMMALWLLILRGISIEFRSHQENPLWRSFWDGLFFLSSTLMAVILGAALGCVIRGVPLGADGYFQGPLFTDFQMGPNPGVLDWYTVLVGVFATLALAGHGALYLTWKTEGPVQARSREWGKRMWLATAALVVPLTLATAHVAPRLYANLQSRPWTGLLVVGIIGSLTTVFVASRRQRDLTAFLGSVGFLVSLLGATAAGLFPNLLTSTLNHAYDLHTGNASAGAVGLQAGLLWWGMALLLAVCYFSYLFYSFRGKVILHHEEH